MRKFTQTCFAAAGLRPALFKAAGAAVLLAALACGGGGGSSSGTAGPAITSFLAAPASVAPGASAQLTGVFSNGTGVIVQASPSGSFTANATSSTPVTVTPAVTTTYTLTVTGASGTTPAVQTAQVAVATPTITSFQASPATITAGNSASLIGDFSYGTGVITQTAPAGPFSAVATSGAGVTVAPAVTTTYTLTVTGATGTTPATQTAQVTVNGAPSSLSADQAAYEQFVMSPQVSYGFNWYLPATGLPTVGGGYWLGESHATLAASPLTAGPQTIQSSTLADITSELLGFPGANFLNSPYHPARYLVGGQIVVAADPTASKGITSYQGTAVRSDTLDAGGTTVVRSYLRTGFSITSLAGTVVSAPTELAQWFNALFSDGALLNATTDWAAGSKYLKYTETQVGDSYRVLDWSTTLVTTGTLPQKVATGSILTRITATTGFTSSADGITYTLTNGAITTVNGIPTYVANVTRPTVTTPSYHIFFDLNGNIYSGELVKDGTVIGGNSYQVSGTTHYDQNYQIRLNAAAEGSLKSALLF